MLTIKPELADNSMIISVLSVVTDKHLRWGFPKYFNRIRKLGYNINGIINGFIGYIVD